MKQLTKGQAIKIAESGEWKKWSDEDVVRFQLYQKFLCMDFSRFHEAMEKVLDRPMFTHEFAFYDKLVSECEGKKKKPSFEEILSLIPKEKLVLLKV